MAMQPFSMYACASLLATFAALPHKAEAYVRAKAQENQETYLYWPTRNLSYILNEEGCASVPLPETLGAIKRSFFSWASPSCTDLSFSFGGKESVQKTNLTLAEGERSDQRNLIVWRNREWPPPGVTDATVTKDMPAVTSVIYEENTGIILDADMDLNGHDFSWTVTDDTTAASTDIQNILTHEIGHFLGLDHSPDQETTMYAKTGAGEMKKRTLAQDDIDGLCFIYPFGQATPKGPGETPPSEDGAGGCQLAAAPFCLWDVMTLAPLLLVLLRRPRGRGGVYPRPKTAASRIDAGGHKVRPYYAARGY